MVATGKLFEPLHLSAFYVAVNARIMDPTLVDA